MVLETNVIKGKLQRNEFFISFPVYSLALGSQSYKHFTLVNYESEIVILGNFQSG